LNIYGGTLISGKNARALNILLIVTGIALFALTVSVWMRPSLAPYNGHARSVREHGAGGAHRPLGRTAYNIVVNNDIFRASRKRYVAPKEALPVRNTARAGRLTQLPGLTLLGTVILHESTAAIISLRGKENDANLYMLGDTIEGFTIKRIDKDSVLLGNGTQVLTLPLSPPNETAAKGATPRSGSYRRYGR